MVNIVLILIALRPKYCQEKVENSISKHLNFKIFWGGVHPQTPWEAHTFGTRKIGCCLLSEWGHLLQNLLTALIQKGPFMISLNPVKSHSTTLDNKISWLICSQKLIYSSYICRRNFPTNLIFLSLFVSTQHSVLLVPFILLTLLVL